MEFNPFDREAETEINARNLPHWFQAGAATFITFRTVDSMPRKVVLRWQRELQEWLVSRGLSVETANAVTENTPEARERVIDQLDSNARREFKRLSDRVWHRSLDECHGKCCLLYTSPSPRDRQKSRMPSSA